MKLQIFVTLGIGTQLSLCHVVVPVVPVVTVDRVKSPCAKVNKHCTGKCGTSTEPDKHGTLLDSLYSFVRSVYPGRDPYGPELFDPTSGESLSEPLPVFPIGVHHHHHHHHTLHVPQDTDPPPKCPYSDGELHVLLDAALNRYGRQRALREIRQRRRRMRKRVMKLRRKNLRKSDNDLSNFVMNIPHLGTVEVELSERQGHSPVFRVRKNSKWTRLTRGQFPAISLEGRMNPGGNIRRGHFNNIKNKKKGRKVLAKRRRNRRRKLLKKKLAGGRAGRKTVSPPFDDHQPTNPHVSLDCSRAGTATANCNQNGGKLIGLQSGVIVGNPIPHDHVETHSHVHVNSHAHVDLQRPNLNVHRDGRHLHFLRTRQNRRNRRSNED